MVGMKVCLFLIIRVFWETRRTLVLGHFFKSLFYHPPYNLQLTVHLGLHNMLKEDIAGVKGLNVAMLGA